MRRLLAALFALDSSPWPRGAGRDDVGEDLRTGVLTVGTRRGSPPFGFVSKTNEWVGFSIDLVEQAIKPAIEKKLARYQGGVEGVNACDPIPSSPPTKSTSSPRR